MATFSSGEVTSESGDILRRGADRQPHSGKENDGRALKARDEDLCARRRCGAGGLSSRWRNGTGDRGACAIGKIPLNTMV